MKIRGHTTTVLAVPLAVAAMTLLGMGRTVAFAQAPGMGAPPSKVEITIKDRQHGYETVGLTMPSHDTTIMIHNKDSVTHGFASNLFKGIPVRVEGGVEVVGKNFKSYHVDPGKTMTLAFRDRPVEVRSGHGHRREHAARPLVRHPPRSQRGAVCHRNQG
jgi:hypothetical protein